MYTLFFDIDGTLLNTGGAGQAAMEAAIRDEFQVDKPADGIPTAGRTDRAILVDLFAYYGVEMNDAAFDRFMQAYLRNLPQFLAERDGTVLPGIASLLDLLAARDDVLLGLLTGNFADGARLKLENFQLHHHFPCGGFGDRHDHRDDVAREAVTAAREHYADALRLDRLWVIGDTPADVQCGRAIGATVVAVATGVYAYEDLAATGPDFLFTDFSQPERLLTELL